MDLDSEDLLIDWEYVEDFGYDPMDEELDEDYDETSDYEDIDDDYVDEISEYEEIDGDDTNYYDKIEDEEDGKTIALTAKLEKLERQIQRVEAAIIGNLTYNGNLLPPEHYR